MTISATTNKATFAGSGSTGPFTFALRFFNNSEISISKLDANAVVTTLVETTDYTLTGAGTTTGGSITLTTALATGETLYVVRNLPLTQPTSIRNQGAFYPEIHEDGFDRLTMQTQQVAESAARALTIPVTDGNLDMEMPSSAARASKILGFDALGLPAMYDRTSYLLNLGVPVGNYASLNAAVSALGSAESTLLINEPCVMTGNLTSPSNISLLIVKGGSITTTGYTLTINGPFEAGLYQVFAGDGTVVFGKTSVDKIIARWFGNNGLAIQKAINSAAAVKNVFIPGGVWEISTPIIIPNDLSFWGMNISGVKDEEGYQNLPSAATTTLKAIAAIPVVIGNRQIYSGTAGYYNKLSNVKIDGNYLADVGYLNGYQDKFVNSLVTRCTSYGIVCGSSTNSTILSGVSSTYNSGSGIWLTGSDSGVSTITNIDNCRFRENSKWGIVLSQSYGVNINNTVFEGNSYGSTNFGAVKFDYSAYTGSNANSVVTTFHKCYFEGNYVTVSAIGSTGKTGDVTFNECMFTVGGAPTAFSFDFFGARFIRSIFYNPATISYNAYGSIPMILEDNTYAASYPTIIGLGKWIDVVKRFDNWEVRKGVIHSAIRGIEYIKPADAILSAEEVSGSLISNSGQGASNITYTLPTADLIVGPPRYVASFVVAIKTAQPANTLTITAGPSAIYYNGIARTTITTNPAVGSAIRFIFYPISGVGVWLAEVISGTWVGAY